MVIPRFPRATQTVFYNENDGGYRSELQDVTHVLEKISASIKVYAKKKIHEMVTFVYVLRDIAARNVRR